MCWAVRYGPRSSSSRRIFSVSFCTQPRPKLRWALRWWTPTKIPQKKMGNAGQKMTPLGTP